MKHFAVFQTAFLLVFCAQLTYADNLGVAANYDVLTFGSFTGSSDSQGRLAIGGNATLTGFGIGSDLGANNASYPYSLVVGGNLTYSNGTIGYGGVAVGGTGSLTNAAVNGNVNSVGTITTQNSTINGNLAAGHWTNNGGTTVTGATNGTPASISSIVNFSSLQSTLTGDSTFWGGLGDTGTVNSGFNQLTLTGSLSGVNIFDISAAQLAGATGGISINAPSGSTVLVNVTGTNASFPSTGFSVNGVSFQDVIFNFSNATTLSGSGSFYGAILAPNATFTFNNGQIDGNVIVNSMSGSGETHYDRFQGNLPSAVPEPGSVILMGSGALALLFGMRRLRRCRPSFR